MNIETAPSRITNHRHPSLARTYREESAPMKLLINSIEQIKDTEPAHGAPCPGHRRGALRS